MKHIICGLISALLGIWGIIVWWYEFGAVMRGMVPFVLLAFGVIGIIAGLQTQQQESDKGADNLTEEAPETE
jgi:hypothetical protein